MNTTTTPITTMDHLRMPRLPVVAAAATASIIDHTRRVHVQDQPWSVRSLVRDYHPENTSAIVVPEGQRQWAWKSKKGLAKQQRLVDSIFYGFPVPSIIFNRRDEAGRPARLEIYDGRHRIETLWRYHNDKFRWQGYLFSELCAEDRRIFLERTLPVTTAENATNEQLADMFIRLNAGVPLKDYDLLWARKDTPLVRATRELVCRNDRLSNALGGLDLEYRNDLANWVSIVAGLSTWNSGNMTTSFIRLSGDEGLGLDMGVHPERVTRGIAAVCALLEDANTRYPALPKQQRALKKVGKVLAFFLHDWMDRPDDRAGVHAKWVDVIGRLRSNDEISRQMSAALTTTGAQNLTATKISQTLEQVNAYLARGVIALPPTNDSSDDEDD